MSELLYPPPEPAAIIIQNDGGGVVNDYKRAVRQYAWEGRQVKVKGSCRSACTLVLAYSNACVYRSAVLKWHYAYVTSTGTPDMAVTEEMINWMPWSIQTQIRSNIGKNYEPGAIMTGAQLIANGVKECKS